MKHTRYMIRCTEVVLLSVNHTKSCSIAARTPLVQPHNRYNNVQRDENQYFTPGMSIYICISEPASYRYDIVEHNINLLGLQKAGKNETLK